MSGWQIMGDEEKGMGIADTMAIFKRVLYGTLVIQCGIPMFFPPPQKKKRCMHFYKKGKYCLL